MTADEYQQKAREHFSYLVDDFGFEEKPIPTDSNEYQVRFETDRTRVAIEGINWGFNVDIRVASTDPNEMKYPSYCFHDLLELRKVDVPYPEPVSDSVSGDIQVEQMKVFSAALRDHAPDVLRDDHTIFPELAAAIDRRAKKYAQEQ